MRGSGPSRLSPSFLIHSFTTPVPCWQTFVSMGGYYGLFHKTLGSRLQTDMLEGKQKLEFLLFCRSIDALQLWQTWYRDMTSISHQQRSVSAHPEVSDSSGGAECCPFQLIVGLLLQLMFFFMVFAVLSKIILLSAVVFFFG